MDVVTNKQWLFCSLLFYPLIYWWSFVSYNFSNTINIEIVIVIMGLLIWFFAGLMFFVGIEKIIKGNKDPLFLLATTLSFFPFVLPLIPTLLYYTS